MPLIIYDNDYWINLSLNFSPFYVNVYRENFITAVVLKKYDFMIAFSANVVKIVVINFNQE